MFSLISFERISRDVASALKACIIANIEFIIKLNVQSLKVLYDFAFKFVGGINAARCCMFSNSQENIENQPFFANQ